MANTSSARKAARVIARRTDVNTARRSRMRTSVRKVEEAIASGDKAAALAALKSAEPEIMRAAQKGVDPSQRREPQGLAPGARRREARQVSFRIRIRPD